MGREKRQRYLRHTPGRNAGEFKKDRLVITDEDFADLMARIIAEGVVGHIISAAQVSSGADWAAGGQYPVAGSATGKVS